MGGIIEGETVEEGKVRGTRKARKKRRKPVEGEVTEKD